MEKVRWKGKWILVVALVFLIGVNSEKTSVRKVVRGNDRELKPSLGVQLIDQYHRQVVMNNGLVQVTLSKPEGEVIGIKYNGIENVLEMKNEEDNRGYWDIVWYEPNKHGTYDRLTGTDFKVISEDENQVEVSFTRTWDMSLRGSLVPLNVDKRYIMRRGISGFYFYAIMERKKGWPDVDMDQIRAVFKLRQDKFHFMAISNDRQRIMPMPEDRATGQRLAYPEAVLLTNPINPDLRGQVDDKYQYSCEDTDNRVHGWISSDPPVGFWMITPSDEFRSGGPNKQDLTSHVGPTVLSMFTSTHYAGKEINTKYRNGEPWKKVFGPSLVYLNSVSSEENPRNLWEDAKQQMMVEVRKWPYNFPQSIDFPKSYQRGQVSGQLQVRDRYISNGLIMWGDSAYVGLAAPGDVGSWEREAKGYQFWTKADKKGYFRIQNVREGEYNLYAWVPGIVGDFKHNLIITVISGSKINLGVIVYEPPRNGPTLWEIGFPDRSAAEFFVPDPQPALTNQLYTNHPDKFRQYGLWERYADLYRNDDLQYIVGVSDYSKDWFFAHVTRATRNRTYKATTWKVIFDLKNVNRGNYTLQMALASATDANLQVRFNNPNAKPPHFATGVIGKDNAIARHGIHGLYRFFSIDVPCYLLYRGKNTIYLTQSRSISPFQGVLYDYIRLEGPPPET